LSHVFLSRVEEMDLLRQNQQHELRLLFTQVYRRLSLSPVARLLVRRACSLRRLPTVWYDKCVMQFEFQS